MKKILLFVAVLAAFSFASCKKDRTCTCTTTYGNGSPSTTFAITLIKSKKGDAKKACINETKGSGSTLETTTCDLK